MILKVRPPPEGATRVLLIRVLTANLSKDKDAKPEPVGIIEKQYFHGSSVAANVY